MASSVEGTPCGQCPVAKRLKTFTNLAVHLQGTSEGRPALLKTVIPPAPPVPSLGWDGAWQMERIFQRPVTMLLLTLGSGNNALHYLMPELLELIVVGFLALTLFDALSYPLPVSFSLG